MENSLNEFFKHGVEDEKAEYPEYSKDEFIEKAQALLAELFEKHREHYKPICDEDMPEDPTTEQMCPQCNGFLYYEAGGEIRDCNACAGTGLNKGRKFDDEGFLEWLEASFLFGSEFIELSIAKIKEE